ncbi:CcdB family protein [Azospirillum sp.]|uniref:CcdB family protein n=1 Tax=Azospirillum sp. TaxID=34012 RepID=UPI002D6DEEE8|nr:CcdB family protein [Azospirillum sp.]HYD70588.1 CcdB family protein [Azospirillum sp.]
MARFDVHRNPHGPGYLLDVQADLMSLLNTRVVVPLLPPKEAPQPANRLNPVFDVGDERVVMVTQFLAAVPRSELGASVTSLTAHHIAIVGAIDMLLSGY